LAVPRDARYLESEDHATAVTPKVCSLIETKGVSEELSCKLKTSTLGAYPVSPTAKYRPQRLRDRQVAAFILSRLVHVFEEGESAQSLET
jgi:hypothetical protein